MKPIDFFLIPQTIAQKQYDALRMYFVEKKPANEIAGKFGYTYRGFTAIVASFRKKLKKNDTKDLFFYEMKKGRKQSDPIKDSKELIIDLRKKYYSVEDIKVALDSKGIKIAEKTIYNVLHSEGFARLPRRLKITKQQLIAPRIEAEKSRSLTFENEKFKSSSAGVLCLLPYIKHYGIDTIISRSDYPETKSIGRLSSILSFVGLKISNVRRYTADDLWCMDRGLGLFATLNVLPKAAWFTSYSHRVTKEMNLNFLKQLHFKWQKLDLLGDTANLDFTTIPYWGDGEHLENNWSGKRGKALSSMLAVLAHDPDSGIIDYGDTDVRHHDESLVVLEFLDFYRTGSEKDTLKYLVFDSKFTNYENLSKLDDEGIKFVTIRRRGKNMVDTIHKQSGNWKSVRVERAGNKKTTIKVCDQPVFLKGYNKNIRQINITGHGRIKPAIIITNDFDLKIEKVVRKYTRRWLVEKTISEQVEFFHLNNVSSSMVIKVDFDLTMTILAYNIYRLFALDLDRYSHLTAQSLYDKFICNSGDIEIKDQKIIVSLKKKRNLPLLLEIMKQFQNINFPWLENKKIVFKGATYS